MDNLRWALLGLGALIVLGIYLFSRHRSDNKAPRRDAPAVDPVSHWPDPTDEFVSPVRVVGRNESPETAAGVSAATEPAQTESDDQPAWPSEDSSWWRERRTDIPELGDAPDPITAAPPPITPRSDAPQAASDDPQDMVVMLFIAARADAVFSGPAIVKALQDSGLELGTAGVFEYLDNDGNALFHVANMFNPGLFDPAKMAETTTGGLSIFTQLPGPVNGVKVFDRMATIAQKVATQLGGNLLDDERNVYADTAANRIKQEIAAFEQSR